MDDHADTSPKKPLGPFEIPADWEDRDAAAIRQDVRDHWAERARPLSRDRGDQPALQEAPRSRRGFVIVGEGKRED
jgi:hypothetical protein